MIVAALRNGVYGAKVGRVHLGTYSFRPKWCIETHPTRLLHPLADPPRLEGRVVPEYTGVGSRLDVGEAVAPIVRARRLVRLRAIGVAIRLEQMRAKESAGVRGQLTGWASVRPPFA